MKVGDIAFKDDTFVRITQIDYDTVPVVKKETRSLLGFQYTKEVETNQTKNEVSRVWWCEVGEEWRGRHRTNPFSTFDDWDDMINHAKVIIRQVEMIKQLEDDNT
jgi:hypothetical protein